MLCLRVLYGVGGLKPVIFGNLVHQIQQVRVPESSPCVRESHPGDEPGLRPDGDPPANPSGLTFLVLTGSPKDTCPFRLSTSPISHRRGVIEYNITDFNGF